MITRDGINLYSATELSSLVGVTKETIGLYAKKAKISDRRISRVRYYNEEEIRQILQAMQG